MRNAKADRNQPSIVKSLRAVGATVAHIHTVGGGVPDILVGHVSQCECGRSSRVNTLIEIKDGTLPPSRRALTPDEVKFHAEWRGQVAIANSEDEALAAIGAIEVTA